MRIGFFSSTLPPNHPATRLLIWERSKYCLCLETRSTGFIITAGAGRKKKNLSLHSPVVVLPPSSTGARPQSKVPPHPVVTPGQIGALTAVRHGPFWTPRSMTDHRMAIITQLHTMGRGLPPVGLSRPNMLESRSPIPTHTPFCHSHATGTKLPFNRRNEGGGIDIRSAQTEGKSKR